MQFDVRALSPDHLLTLLTVDAADEKDARRQVEARGLFPSAVTPKRAALLGARKNASGRRQLPLVMFSQELLALLRAGLSIVEGLEALLEKEANLGVRAILGRLLLGLREGKRFSSVLAEQGDLFPPLYVGIVKAAEGTSDLPRSLARYIDYQQRIDSVRAKIISATIYPAILLLVGGCVSFFLIGYVVPRFAEVYQGAGRSLPWMSQILLDWGHFAATRTKTLLLGAALLMSTLTLALRHVLTKGGVAKLLARLPGIGERVRIYELSRLYLTLGMLLEGGIPIVAALETVHGMVSPDIKIRLQRATETVQSGDQISTGFESNGLTTPISLRMLRVGERSGELGSMLTQSAAFYDGEISRWIDRFTRVFEPLLMAAIGVVVGAIVVLLYMPIFDLAGSFS
ncbi:general secretion pathway protein F [Collimonas sp. OK307]|uniref:type II secretion system F family protein n=1 Tax=Collimonas sp. OK307 TaxID=1801620 RepID=UPI0008DEE8DC|nr:type II secretion system F family protein [Collimonas sp. OK307]SFI21934.1 general secretion pathway protein F [Collimonas sp. OK307]